MAAGTVRLPSVKGELVALPEYARAGGEPAIFLEITDRYNLGAGLDAPQEDEAGGGRYRLIEETQPGDTVLHYHRPSGGITAISRVAGPRVSEPIVWAAKGTSARGRHLDPYERPGWHVPLAGYRPLDPPLPQDTVRERRNAVFALRDRLTAQHGDGLHFPYYRYAADQLRTLQAYMAVFPRELLDAFPELRTQVEGFEATGDLPGPPPADPDDPDLYLAHEDMQVGGDGRHFVDPAAMTRANQAHAKLQNTLRSLVKGAGGTLEKAVPSANVDLAWRTPRGRLTVAEIKSLTDTNEAHQLRYGLGQLLDYYEEYEAHSEDPRLLLAIPRAPYNLAWPRKCEAAGVTLAWPGNWPSLP